MVDTLLHLVEAVGSKTEEEAQAAMKILIRLGDDAVPALVQAMRDHPNDFVPDYERVTSTKKRQENVARMLRQIGSRVSIRALIGLLSSENTHARSLAGYELSETKRTLQYLKLYDTVIERLFANLESAEDRPTCEAAGFTLARIGDDSVVLRLLRAVRDAHEQVQQQVISGFGMAGDEAAIAGLASVLQSQGVDETMRQLALHALVHSGTPEALAIIEKIASEDG